tara:strand:- start:589 stop:1107 length:519 start_codon:yes stop_codon:yes gene_type:complete
MVSLAELQVGAEGLTGQPVSDFVVPTMETITTSDYGGSLPQSQLIFDTTVNAAGLEALERAELARYTGQMDLNRQQAEWAAEQTTPTITENIAQTYVDFYEGDTTTANLLTDPIEVLNPVGIITDVLGTDIITGGITAVGGALEPITAPIGQGLGKLVVPAVIIGGALLFLK